ncbi:MAG: conserved hypothetical rane spanning protein [Sphingomonas bacterium]|uniref:CBU_0592 family membrane protein n=1 Tax=Sphingomonas bacterium TaxID=1895847 RepID=UPI002638F2FE|nr:hypothetical protein [Sphingomonas bacterium]MDB5695416.1 conserved hypothetical rane spanning protein [Sphingomonas bacterium]
MDSFTLLDAIGLLGVLLLLIAYGLTVGGRIDPLKPAALLLNLLGAIGILISLLGAFNLSALVIETAWAVIAIGGLARWWWQRGKQGS